MECAPKVKKTSNRRYQKPKRGMINRHRQMQNKDVLKALQSLRNAAATNENISNKNFERGFLNAVSEVSRLLASIPDVDINMGKAIMTHLGLIYNRFLQQNETENRAAASVQDFVPPSPASSGYFSDCDSTIDNANVWRPWIN